MHATIARFPKHYEVEEDITTADILTRRRPTKFADDHDHYLGEVEHLEGYGITDPERVAKYLGVNPSTYEKAVSQKGGREYTGRNAECIKALDELIAAGEPFTAKQLPLADHPRFPSTIIARAKKTGRIKSLGRTPDKASIHIWQPI